LNFSREKDERKLRSGRRLGPIRKGAAEWRSFYWGREDGLGGGKMGGGKGVGGKKPEGLFLVFKSWGGTVRKGEGI